MSADKFFFESVGGGKLQKIWHEELKSDISQLVKTAHQSQATAAATDSLARQRRDEELVELVEQIKTETRQSHPTTEEKTEQLHVSRAEIQTEITEMARDVAVVAA